mgnify:FL=1
MQKHARNKNKCDRIINLVIFHLFFFSPIATGPMPDTKTKFNKSWLDKWDYNGNLVKTWLKQGSSETTFVCTICRTGDLDCAKRGWKAVEQHMLDAKHKKNSNAFRTNSLFTVSTSTMSSISSTNIIQVLNSRKYVSFDDQVSKAEI